MADIAPINDTTHVSAGSQQVINGANTTSLNTYYTLSKAWAIFMDGLVENTDYSSKYYALQSKGFQETASAAADSILNNAGFIAVVADLTGNNTIGTVASNIGNVNAVGNDILKVSGVYDDLTNIDSVYSDLAVINTVADNISVVNGVYNNISTISAVNDNETNVNTVANNAQNIQTVVNNITDIQNAEENAALASQKATAASNSATAAATSASNAATSESNALSYKNSAYASATNAATSESNALSYKNSAYASATNAATSESNALSYKNSAYGYMNTASTKASEASTSASNASISETNAANSATAASNSAMAAASSAEDARRYAEQSAAGQVNSDWNVTDTTSKAYILNKPDVMTTDTAQTISVSAKKTFNGAVNFVGSGDTNAVFISTNTRLNVYNTNQTVLGFGNGTFYINHSSYALLLRGSSTRPAYNTASNYLALYSDLNSKQNVSNLVTSISSSSTDTQYPSAKCTYDKILAATRFKIRKWN